MKWGIHISSVFSLLHSSLPDTAQKSIFLFWLNQWKFFSFLCCSGLREEKSSEYFINSTSNGWWCSSENKQTQFTPIFRRSLKRDFQEKRYQTEHLETTSSGQQRKSIFQFEVEKEKFFFVFIKYLIFLLERFRLAIKCLDLFGNPKRPARKKANRKTESLSVVRAARKLQRFDILACGQK